MPPVRPSQALTNSLAVRPQHTSTAAAAPAQSGQTEERLFCAITSALLSAEPACCCTSVRCPAAAVATRTVDTLSMWHTSRLTTGSWPSITLQASLTRSWHASHPQVGGIRSKQRSMQQQHRVAGDCSNQALRLSMCVSQLLTPQVTARWRIASGSLTPFIRWIGSGVDVVLALQLDIAVHCWRGQQSGWLWRVELGSRPQHRLPTLSHTHTTLSFAACCHR